MSDMNKRGGTGGRPSPSAKRPGTSSSASARRAPSSGGSAKPAAGTKKKSAASGKASHTASDTAKTRPRQAAQGTPQKKNGAPQKAPQRSSGEERRQPVKNAPSKSARPAASGTRPKAGQPKSQTAANRKPPARSSAAKRPERKKDDGHKRVADQELRNSPGAVKLEENREKRISQKNHTLYRTVYFLAVSITIFVVGFMLARTVLFHISTINIEIGEGVPYTEAEILEASGVREGKNLFSVTPKTAAQNIMYALPYIERATVRRKLPSTINITAEPAQILGLALNADKQLVVLSTSGKALEVLHGNKPSDMPVINGMIVKKAEVGRVVELEDPEQLAVAAQVVESFRSNEIEPDSLTFSPTGSTISAVYDKRIDIKLGAVSGIEEKLELAAMLIREGKISEGEAGILDLTIKGRATFRPNYVEENSGQLDFIYEQNEEEDEPEESGSDVYEAIEEETP